MPRKKRSGTKPNTYAVLTQAELDYIKAHWQGRKSAAIHAALAQLMQTDTTTTDKEQAQ